MDEENKPVIPPSTIVQAPDGTPQAFAFNEPITVKIRRKEKKVKEALKNYIQGKQIRFKRLLYDVNPNVLDTLDDKQIMALQQAFDFILRRRRKVPKMKYITTTWVLKNLTELAVNGSSDKIRLDALVWIGKYFKMFDDSIKIVRPEESEIRLIRAQVAQAVQGLMENRNDDNGTGKENKNLPIRTDGRRMD